MFTRRSVQTAVIALACSSGAAAQVQRVILDNGVIVLLQPASGFSHVAVESMYRVGFIDEPRAMPQAAHLIEHLACWCATESYASGESFRLLASRGLVNAETLGDWTHYDYAVPAGDLELVLGIEAERLTSPRIDREIIAQEGPRCAAEFDYAQQAPGTPVFKFAMMAASQFWRWGLDEASIATDLGEMDAGALIDFHRDHYVPERLAIAVTGDFDADACRRIIEEKFGGLKRGEAGRPAIDWSRVPAAGDVRWDGRASAVMVAFPPPDTAAERLAATAWAMTAASFRGPTVMTNAPGWIVGDLPVFFAGAVEPGGDMAAVEDAVRAAIAGAKSRAARAGVVGQLRQAVRMIAQPPTLDLPAMRAQATRTAGGNEARGEQMALAQAALELVKSEIAPIEGGTVEEVLAWDAADWKAFVDRLTREENAKVVRIRPSS